MNKLTLIILFSILPLAGCFADYSTKLKNGYIYNNWGNNFISHKSDKEEREIIKGQVKNYASYENVLVAIRYDLSTPNILQYWILNMDTHFIQAFDTRTAFEEAAKNIKGATQAISKL